ncbi:MAG: ABC transporter substrate binding protein [Campylobacterota bacterium]|nr:ABC transporter substrate binding protein [Campylobacterota bacterium]
MKKFFILLIMLLNFAFADGSKHILLLNSYHQGMTWVDNLTKGVHDILNIEKNNYIVHIENMDTKRHNTKEYYESVAYLYKNKYKDIKLDLILSSDNNAFDFLRKYRDDIFGDIPVSFSGVNNFSKSMLEGYSNYTGVAENFSDISTVNTILKLHPNTKKIYILNDYLKTGRAWEASMRKNLEIFKDKVEIQYSENQTLQELQNTVKSLEKGTVLLMGVFFADKNKEYLTYEKIGKSLLDQSPVPVYCLLNFNISNGVVGGDVISGYHQGAMMAKLGLSILQGINPADIEIVEDGANKFIFNDKALKKFNIDKTILPKNSIIINEKESLYKKYGLSIIIFLVVFAIFVLTFLLFYNKKSLNSEKSILRLIVYAPLIFIPSIIAILIYTILSNNNEIFENNIKELEKSILISQKQLTMFEVEKLSKEIIDKDDTRENILNYINLKKYSNNGYFFALNKKGLVLAHGVNKELIGKNVYNYKDNSKEYYIRSIIRNAMNNSLEFVDYEWENPETKQVETKYTYAKYIPKYDMIISSGVYVGNIQKELNKRIKELNDKNEDQIHMILFISSVVLLLSLVITFILSNIIKKIFKNYSKELDSKNKNLEEVNTTLEKRVQERTKNLENERNKIKTFLDATMEAIFISKNGICLDVNKSAVDIFGYDSKEDMIGKKLIDFVAPESHNIVQQKLKDYDSKPYEGIVSKKDKSKFTAYIRGLNVDNTDLRISSVIDITHLKQLELQSKHAAMGEMIGNIAHQWRQPLSVISSASTGILIKKEYGLLDDTELESLCKKIDQNAQYLSQTIDDFRDFIKDDTKPVNFNLKDDTKSFIKLMESNIKNNKIQIIMDLQDDIDLNGFPNELIQCFIDIFNNAKDAFIQNNVNEDERFIFITQKIIENNVVISFKDNAGGIPENIKAKIFEPYFTTKHESQGTGLGLHMSYNLIVNHMKGSIDVFNHKYEFKDQKYKGAEFVIMIPLT